MVAEVPPRKVIEMKALTREEEVVRQVELGKKGQFGLTGIKVELEALFDRRGIGAESTGCDDCEGSGYKIHGACNENGCDSCDFRGNKMCKCYFKRNEWGNDHFCQQWLMRELQKIGLAKIDRKTRKYVAKQPLVFGKFYTDPSVDAEFTFTINLNKPENIFFMPKVIEIWNKMGEAIGNGCDVSNAGMHMALLRNKKCYYPDDGGFSGEDELKYNNFEKSMRLLIPALFFLGTSNSRSRGLRFREPKVSGSKYSAIHLYGNALEFRVFETCYDNPEASLDNFVVMRNCIRFWSSKYRNPNLHKITPNIKFGNDNNERIDRFYTTVRHLDLLSAGLTKIKPSYYTLKELKEQREFRVNKKELNKKLDAARKNAELAFKEYDQRYEWEKEINKAEIMYRSMRNSSRNPTPEEREQIRTNAEADAKIQETYMDEHKQSSVQYVEEEVKKFIDRSSGQYSLVAA